MSPLLKNALLTCSLIAGVGMAPAASAADTLEIKNFIGTVIWSNGDMSVDIDKNKGKTEVTGRRGQVIDGGQNDIDGKKCKSSYGSFSLDLFGKEKNGNFGGYEDLDKFPVLTIEVPEDTAIIIENSILFTQGDPNVAKADIQMDHCGKVSLGDIAQTLALDSRGSADVSVGTTGQIAANLRGSGDLVGRNSGDVLIRSQGSGDVDLEDIRALEANLFGSGDLTAEDVTGDADLTTGGSGDIDLDTVTGSLIYSSSGSGDLDVSAVIGAKADLSSTGSGDIDIGGGRVDLLKAVSRGSASIEFSGEAEAATLHASGSGDIRVDRVSGDVDIKSAGSGNVDIDERG